MAKLDQLDQQKKVAKVFYERSIEAYSKYLEPYQP
jgi:hypothetical protein